MKTINTIYLFIHAPSKRPMRSGLGVATEIEERWRTFVRERGADEQAAVCVIQGGFGGDPELVKAAEESFGDRSVIDPDDSSGETKQLIAEDLERCFAGRGSHGEWNIYEIWSSNNARRWAEGIKKSLADHGYAYDPQTVRLETFGNWTGCHHKYTNFLACYLGARNPAHVHADAEWCTLKDIAVPPVETLEEISLDEGVMLYLFRGENDVPIAQYWDGLRPVWERPHLAQLAVDSSKVMPYTFSPNAYIQVDGASGAQGDQLLLDVGDGARPAYSTLVGVNLKTREPWNIDEFGRLCRGARIIRWDRSVSVYYRVEV